MEKTTTGSPRSGKGLEFPGMHKVWAKGSLYIYAWRRGPRLEVIKASTKAAALAELENPHIAAKIAGKLAEHVSPRPSPAFISGLIADFRRSPTFQQYRESTRDQWSRHLNAIDDVFGTTSLKSIQARGSRALIKAWHAQVAEIGPDGRPLHARKANYRLTVLARLFSWAVDDERMDKNPAAGIARIDEGPGRQEITWSAGEFEALCRQAAPRLALALRLAYLTGMRPGDLIRLTWNEVDRRAGLIRRATSKSNRNLVARIPITADIAQVLDALAALPLPASGVRSLNVVTSERGTPYASTNSFSRSFEKARDRTRISGIEAKHLHDLRGTRATLDFADGMTDADAERKFGWAPGQGGKMRKVYENPEQVALARRRVG